MAVSAEEITTRPPHIDLDEGNEEYFDTELITLLTDMENNGRENEVNVILDWLCLLINRFEDRGYSEKAILQVQRFFFLERERFLPLGYDTVTEQLSRCIPREGTDAATLTAAVKEVLGWNSVGKLSFVFESEVGV